MQTISNDFNAGRGRLLPTQIVIYAALVIGTGFVLWPAITTSWRKTLPVHQSANVGKSPGVVSPSHPDNPLVQEVQAVVDHWKKEGFAWSLQVTPTAMYNEVLPVDMRGLETVDLSAYRKAAMMNWQSTESLPTLAGAYRRGRIAASAWPRPGSAAIELVPAMATDPDLPAKPWRVVLLYGATADATTYARQAVANAGSEGQELLNLGRAAQSVLAVPVDRQTVEGQITYYCICPTQSVLQISGVKLSQVVQQPSSPNDAASKRYGTWKSAYDTFLATVRERDRTAATPEQRQQIKADILAWKATNPEPPRPSGYEAGQQASGAVGE